MLQRLLYPLLFLTLFINRGYGDTSEPRNYPPLILLTPKRADVCAKYIYGKLLRKGTDCSFGRDIYYHHLRVWNRFQEAGAPMPRFCFEDFDTNFQNILASIENNSFDPTTSILPLNYYGDICDGSHRLAASLLYADEVTASIFIDVKHRTPWDFAFFRDRGLDEKYLDAMALQYCELKPNTYVLVVFPSAEGYKKLIEPVIHQHAQIVHKKKIYFTERGAKNFIFHAYEKEGWGHESIKAKSALCFPKHRLKNFPTKVYLLEATSLQKITRCKDALRRIFKIEHDSVHTTDTYQETLILARTLFNKNSIHMLNHRSPKQFQNFSFLFDQYRDWFFSQDLETQENFCIDTSACLAVYGLRDCNDLDYIHFGDSSSIRPDFPGIDDHNYKLRFHDEGRDTLLFDPDQHFYYLGVKFCSLENIRKMKANRNEKRDREDIALIDKMLKH